MPMFEIYVKFSADFHHAAAPVRLEAMKVHFLGRGWRRDPGTDVV